MRGGGEMSKKIRKRKERKERGGRREWRQKKEGEDEKGELKIMAEE